MKQRIIKFIIVCLTLIFIAFICWMFIGFRDSTHSNIDDYSKDVTEIYEARSFMPSLDKVQIGATDVDYHKKITRTLLSDSYALTLEIEYSNEEYEFQKIQVLAKYPALEEIIADDYSEGYCIPEISFSNGLYEFYVVYNEKFEYPKWFGLIGTSDKEKRITYVWFYDHELDRISLEPENTEGAMSNFLKNYFVFELGNH